MAAVVRPAQAIDVIDDDPADNRALEAASEGSADVIASGDKHPLRLGAWQSVRIKRVADLISELKL